MSFSDWLIVGCATWFLKKGLNNAAAEREQQEMENHLKEEERKKLLKESSRKSAVNNKRENTPCFFKDGISNEEFVNLAQKIGRKMNRIKEVSINGAAICCTVESQTGYSTWEFIVDFNDWGHITGARKTWSENTDSNIPEHFGNMMTSAIHQLLANRNIHLLNYSDAVDANSDLETKNGLEFHKKNGLIKKIFSKKKNIVLQYDAASLKGEHLYPVISFLKNNGFCNLKSVPIKDIGRDSTYFLFEVEQIVINGSSFFEEGNIFNENNEIIITYHEKQEILMPFAEKHFRKRNYIDVNQELQTLDFSKICVHAIRDLTTGWFKKNGSVERVTISGEKIQKNTVYKYDDKIVIEYHTFKKNVEEK